MKIGIVGQGFVGNAIYQKFKNFFDVLTYDLDKSKCNSNQKLVYSCEVVFVCLPTPMNKDGSCNVNLIEKTISEICKFNKAKIVVIKSTISIGSTERFNSLFPNLNIVFNPEFLTEANAVQDFNNQNRIILGGSGSAINVLTSIYSRIFPSSKIVITSSGNAEMVKYMTNSFLALKVSFANEIYNICDKLNLDYDKIIEYVTLDDRISKSHLQVPGPDGDFGFGGHCLPKDLNELISLAKKNDIETNVISATKKTNDTVRNNRNWERMKGRAVI